MIHPVAAPHPDAHRAAALRRAAVLAAGAPSVLNTQPWKLRIRDGSLHVHADRERQLSALDPQRRVLTVSVGCAVFNARTALAADGYGTVVDRFPDPSIPDLVAVITPCSTDVDVDLAPERATRSTGTLPPAVSAAEIPAELIAALRDAVAAEGVELYVLDDGERALVSELNRQADEIENLDPAYRAELDAWTAEDPHHRDRTATASECLGVIVTHGDTAPDWLRAGEAMMRTLRLAAYAQQAVSPSTQIIEVASARAQLRRALHLAGHAHVLLRAGRSYGTPATRRRRLVDVLVEEV